MYWFTYLIDKQLHLYINLYIKKQHVFLFAITIYIPFTLFKSNGVWFEKYKLGISFVSYITKQTVCWVFHNWNGRTKKSSKVSK